MHVFKGSLGDLKPYIRDEVAFAGDVANGKRGMAARRVQEWLALNGEDVVPDGKFGTVTETAVRSFQGSRRLPKTGVVDEATHRALVEPIMRALSRDAGDETTFGKVVAAVARHHLKEHPREVGGDNLGPWVRLYMEGREGPSWFWCAGFVTFVMKQAAELLGQSVPIAGSFSCDTLAAQGRETGRFLAEGAATPRKVTPGAIFLVRRTPGDWTHTGLVTRVSDGVFETIEGNTNDDGSRNGFEVCARRRGFGDKDFVLL